MGAPPLYMQCLSRNHIVDGNLNSCNIQLLVHGRLVRTVYFVLSRQASEILGVWDADWRMLTWETGKLNSCLSVVWKVWDANRGLKVRGTLANIPKLPLWLRLRHLTLHCHLTENSVSRSLVYIRQGQDVFSMGKLRWAQWTRNRWISHDRSDWNSSIF